MTTPTMRLGQRAWARLLTFALTVTAGAAWLPARAALAAEFQRAPAPAWVETLPLDAEAKPPLGQATQGVHYLLVDQQVQVDASGKTSFRRNASRALNERGVESIAHIDIEFDPSYETLTLHALSLLRDGRLQDRLASAQMKVLQRETELEYRVYDGTKTLDIALDDVRAGDVVEYSYSVRGRNPVFGKRGYGRMDMQWHAPVHQLYRRLRVPAGHEPKFQSYLTDLQPHITTRDGWTDYVWQATDVPPLARQSDTPRWFDANAAIRWSDFADWSEVARWAEPLFAVPATRSGALRAEIERIAAKAKTPDERLLAVLDFVQSQIRYLGVEIGPGSHAPRPPDKVLERRYGDCKDKVLLTVTMLRALGVTADPALVNTRLRQAVRNILPTPGAFNHVIVRAHVGEHDFWLDPTRAPQKGSLDRVAQADFGQALVLDGQSTALTPIPTAPSARRRRDIAVQIDASHGFGEPATMEVTSTFEGVSADRMRDTLRNDSVDDLQRDYLNYYLRSYPGLSTTGPLSFADDETANRLVTVEHYRVESLWASKPGSGNPVVYLYAPDMKWMLNRPDDTVRSAPLAVDHPENMTVSITTLLPEDRSIGDSQSEVRNPAFEFSEATSYRDRTLRLGYAYRSLADHVDPGDLATYLADLEKARNTVGYTLRPTARRATESSTGTLLAVGLWLLLVVAAVVAAAYAVTHGVRRAGENVPGQRSVPQLVGAGVVLVWAPLFGALPFVGAISALTGGFAFFGWWTYIAVLLLCSGWLSYWKGPWLRWAMSHTDDTDRLMSVARRFGLLARPSAA